MFLLRPGNYVAPAAEETLLLSSHLFARHHYYQSVGSNVNDVYRFALRQRMMFIGVSAQLVSDDIRQACFSEPGLSSLYGSGFQVD